MKLSEYAKRMGVAYITAFRWWKAGKIPTAYKGPTGRVIVDESALQMGLLRYNATQPLSEDEKVKTFLRIYHLEWQQFNNPKKEKQ